MAKVTRAQELHVGSLLKSLISNLHSASVLSLPRFPLQGGLSSCHATEPHTSHHLLIHWDMVAVVFWVSSNRQLVCIHEIEHEPNVKFCYMPKEAHEWCNNYASRTPTQVWTTCQLLYIFKDKNKSFTLIHAYQDPLLQSCQTCPATPLLR